MTKQIVQTKVFLMILRRSVFTSVELLVFLQETTNVIESVSFNTFRKITFLHGENRKTHYVIILALF